MTDFLQWLGTTVLQCWQFLSDTTVPGCSFSFAALLLFVLVFNFGIFILKIVFSGDTHGGTKDVNKKLK